ncbi:MAG: hypothetical protein IPO08_21545 [Xanthomonadales bacterium]|nr:hypothetical protein [Xanthomonadales bacterium]
MAWTATFVADTSNLERALSEVEVKLGGVEQESDKLRKSLQKVTSEFDGSKITTQAQTMAAAIAKIDGVSKLTATEQRKVNALVTEAMAKYEALGVKAPAAVSRLSAELQEAAAKTRTLGTATQQTTGLLGGIKTAAIGAFAGFSAAGLMAGAIGGLKRVAGSAIETAGMLSDLAAQTGIQASSLDRMRLAAGPAGVELTKITDVATELGVKLTNGDKSVVAGVKRLGLDLDALKTSKPDAAFLSIVEGLLKIPDPMERARAAYGTFGEKGKEVLRLVNAEFIENARQGKGWSDSQIAQLDMAGQAWEDFGKAVETSTGTILASLIGFEQKRVVLQQSLLNIGTGLVANAVNTQAFWGNAFTGNISFTDKPTAPSAPGAPSASGALGVPSDAEMSKIVASLNAEAAAALKAGGAVKILQDLRLDQRGWDAHVAQLRSETQALSGMAVMAAAAAQGLDSVARSRASVETLTIAGRGDVAARALPNAFELGNTISLGGFVGAGATGGSSKSGMNWGGVMSQLPGQLAGVFSSGGNSGQIGGGLGSLAGGLGGTLAASGLGLAAGSFLGSAVPVIGTLIGGFLGKKLGSLFGPSKNAIATQAANGRIQDSQAGLLSQYGSVANIAGMGAAGADLAAAWGSRGTAGEQQFARLTAEFERQNSLLAEQTTLQADQLSLEQERTRLAESLIPTFATVASLSEKYGLNMDGAGKTVQQLGTTASFTTLINDIETLERAGWDVGGMLEGMSDEISGVVSKSVKFGTEIPANMKPYIEELARSGKLLDENGVAITDLTNIKWGAPVKTEADKVREAMESISKAMEPMITRLGEIVDLLTRRLPAAAAEGARGTQDAWDANRPDFRVDAGGGEPTSSGYAAGGVVSRPRRAWVGEGGQPEIIGSVDFMASALYHAMARAGASGVSGGGSTVVDARIELNGHELGRQMITILPEAARRAGVSLPR